MFHSVSELLAALAAFAALWVGGFWVAIDRAGRAPLWPARVAAEPAWRLAVGARVRLARPGAEPARDYRALAPAGWRGTVLALGAGGAVVAWDHGPRGDVAPGALARA